MRAQIRTITALLAMLTAACAPAAAPQRSAEAPSAPAAGSRQLQVAIPVEPATMAARTVEPVAQNLYLVRRMANAEIAAWDDHGVQRPYLVEALPQLNTESWQVFPDGGMQTTYHLKPGLTWQDGAPATADDFVFGWQVFLAVGHGGLPPFHSIAEVTAPDPRTLVIRWKQPYADVNFLGGLGTEFSPLPRHILESAVQPDQIESFAKSPFWTRDYVGLGPYKVSRWELGAFVEMNAFEGHVGGKPKIDRMRLLFSTAQTATTRLLAGEVELSAGVGLELSTLKQEWIAPGAGNVVLHANQWQAVHFQFRPDYQATKALMNPAIRKALAHSVDRALLNETLLDGDGILLDSPVSPQSIWAAAADRGAVKYPYDPRRSEQLAADAGFAKGPDGVYSSPTEGRVSFEVKGNAGATEPLLSFLAADWRKSGFEAQETVLPAALGQNPEVRATFPGAFFNQQNCCESGLLGLTSVSIGSAENRWTGGNRSGWHDPEYDRLAESFSKTLDGGERERQLTRMVQIVTEQVQAVQVQNVTQPWLYGTALHGLVPVPPETFVAWNIDQWELH